jgi:hypothetical protein
MKYEVRWRMEWKLSRPKLRIINVRCKASAMIGK